MVIGTPVNLLSNKLMNVGLRHFVYLSLIFLIAGQGKICAQNWETLGEGVNITARDLYTDTLTNRLYAIGVFTLADDTVDVGGVTYWDGIQWNALDSGNTECPSCNPITSITTFQGEVYIAGQFTSFANVPNTKFMARYNGTTWESMGDVNGLLWFYHYNNQLIMAVGTFDTINGVYAKNLALYDGISWTPFDTASFIQPGQFINCMAEYNGELYAGGNFDLPNGVEEIAKFDGNAWVSVGGGILGNAWVNKMVVYQNELYVAGFFHKSAGNAGNGIMKWDGSNWSDCNNGLALTGGGQIFDMEIYNGELIVQGWMALGDGIPMQNLAKWDGSKWCSFRNSFNGTAVKIELYNNELIVACQDSMDLEPEKYIAKWIGGNQSDTCGIVGIEENNLEDGIAIYPNPNNGSFIIDINDIDTATINIYSITGQLILQKTLTQNTTKVDLLNSPKGIYFLKVKTANKTIVEKIVYQ